MDITKNNGVVWKLDGKTNESIKCNSSLLNKKQKLDVIIMCIGCGDYIICNC